MVYSSSDLTGQLLSFQEAPLCLWCCHIMELYVSALIGSLYILDTHNFVVILCMCRCSLLLSNQGVCALIEIRVPKQQISRHDSGCKPNPFLSKAICGMSYYVHVPWHQTTSKVRHILDRYSITVMSYTYSENERHWSAKPSAQQHTLPLYIMCIWKHCTWRKWLTESW